MKISTLVKQPALALALLCAATPFVHAQEAPPVVDLTPQVQFMTGGIGQSEEAAVRKAEKNFKLRMAFSERKDNEFAADVDLRVTDMSGRPVFVLLDADPMVNLNLPDGRYRVMASLDGQTETRLVTLHGGAGENLNFHWKGDPETDADARLQGS